MKLRLASVFAVHRDESLAMLAEGDLEFDHFLNSIMKVPLNQSEAQEPLQQTEAAKPLKKSEAAPPLNHNQAASPLNHNQAAEPLNHNMCL